MIMDPMEEVPLVTWNSGSHRYLSPSRALDATKPTVPKARSVIGAASAARTVKWSSSWDDQDWDTKPHVSEPGCGTCDDADEHWDVEPRCSDQVSGTQSSGVYEDWDSEDDVI